MVLRNIWPRPNKDAAHAHGAVFEYRGKGTPIWCQTQEDLGNKIGKLARENKNIPMLSRTHGQPASPSTFGKEFKVFEERLKRQLNQVKNHKILAKLNGATGNYSDANFQFLACRETCLIPPC